MAGIVAVLLAAIVPQMAGYEIQIEDNITFIVLAAIAGFTLQDIGILWVQKFLTPELAGKGVQYGMDTFEQVTGKDIPDKVEQLLVEEAQDLTKQLQAKQVNTVTSPVNLDRLHFDPAINDEWLGLAENAKG